MYRYCPFFYDGCPYPYCDCCPEDCYFFDFDTWLEKHPEAVIQSHSYDCDEKNT